MNVIKTLFTRILDIPDIKSNVRLSAHIEAAFLQWLTEQIEIPFPTPEEYQKELGAYLDHKDILRNLSEAAAPASDEDFAAG